MICSLHFLFFDGLISVHAALKPLHFFERLVSLRAALKPLHFLFLRVFWFVILCIIIIVSSSYNNCLQGG